MGKRKRSKDEILQLLDGDVIISIKNEDDGIGFLMSMIGDTEKEEVDDFDTLPLSHKMGYLLNDVVMLDIPIAAINNIIKGILNDCPEYAIKTILALIMADIIDGEQVNTTLLEASC